MVLLRRIDGFWQGRRRCFPAFCRVDRVSGVALAKTNPAGNCRRSLRLARLFGDKQSPGEATIAFFSCSPVVE